MNQFSTHTCHEQTHKPLHIPPGGGGAPRSEGEATIGGDRVSHDHALGGVERLIIHELYYNYVMAIVNL